MYLHGQDPILIYKCKSIGWLFWLPITLKLIYSYCRDLWDLNSSQGEVWPEIFSQRVKIREAPKQSAVVLFNLLYYIVHPCHHSTIQYRGYRFGLFITEASSFRHWGWWTLPTFLPVCSLGNPSSNGRSSTYGCHTVRCGWPSVRGWVAETNLCECVLETDCVSNISLPSRQKRRRSEAAILYLL